MSGAVKDWRPYWPDVAAVFYISERRGSHPVASVPGRPSLMAMRHGRRSIIRVKAFSSRTGRLRRIVDDRLLGRMPSMKNQPHQLLLGTTVPYANFHQYRHIEDAGTAT